MKANTKITGVLAASIILNVFLLGYLIGEKPWQSKPLVKGPLMEQRDPPPQMRKLQQSIQHLRTEIAQELRKSDLDQTRLETLFAQMHQLRAQAGAKSHQHMLKKIQSMPYDKRVKLADRIEKGHRPPRPRR